MLVQALNQHFKDHFLRDEYHDTVLWFDPEQEYAALLDYLTEVPLWRYQGSLLEVRYRLVRRAPGEQVVVYLPLHQEEAEVLRPFFATSLCFHERLYRFLRRQGLNFPDDPDIAHELRGLLPRLAARSVGKGRAFWEYNLANLERARETLLGSFDDALLRFLAQPQAALAEMKQERLDGLFFAQLESAYGFAAAAEDDPAEVARRFTAQLALLRAFVGAGKPEGFPFAARLPEPLYHERTQAFLDRWQRDSVYKSAYICLADELEKHYALAEWVAGLPVVVGLQIGATFARVESALWEKAEAAMSDLESETDWRAWLGQHKAVFHSRACSFWAQEGRAPGWRLLVRAADLLQTIHSVRGELDRVSSPGEMLLRYAEDWWRIDQDWRVLREAIEAHPAAPDRLRKRCALAYRDILGKTNDRFSTLLELEKTWPPAGDTLLPQDDFWPEVARTLKAGQRAAVMFVDALRYELAQDLLAKLEMEGVGTKRQITARLAAIPTVTAIGMSALLLEGHKRQVTYDNDWNVTIADSGNLREKGSRQEWLGRHLKEACFYNLGDLLETSSDRIPEAPIYLIFDNTFDAIGETAGVVAWNALSVLLQSVRKGVHKLLGLGVEQVHIAADHGFLLLQEVADHEKASVRDASALAKKSRYVVGKGLGRTDQLSFPVPGSPDLEAWFPRGIGCFRTPGAYNYVHGGLSLQELVVPHLRVVKQVIGRAVGVRAEFPTRITTGQPTVRLVPVAGELFAQSRQVTLRLEKGGQPVFPPLSVVVGPGDAVTVHVLLPQGCGLQLGDQVRWVLLDTMTDERLAEQEAVSQVDLW